MIRIFEVLVSLLILLALSPLLMLIVVIGFSETGSPIFIQTRVGKNQRPFKLVKFRTMRKTTGDLPTHFVSRNMITKTGSFLRKTKLDELPQFINVLSGSMSLVGPRPCLPTQNELIEERNKRNVFTIKQGITGIAQINNVDMSEPLRLARYDAIMVKNKSLKFYFYCLIATLSGKGQGDAVK